MNAIQIFSIVFLMQIENDEIWEDIDTNSKDFDEDVIISGPDLLSEPLIRCG